MHSSPRSGFTFVGFLAVCLIVFKLTGKITWSWWWVLLPVWGTPVLIFAAALFLFIHLNGAPENDD